MCVFCVKRVMMARANAAMYHHDLYVIVLAVLVSVGVVAAGAQLAVTVLLLTMYGFVRHHTFYELQEVDGDLLFNTTRVDELSYLSDAFRVYPAFSATWVVALWPTGVVIVCLLRLLWHHDQLVLKRTLSMNLAERLSDKALKDKLSQNHRQFKSRYIGLLVCSALAYFFLLTIVLFNNGQESRGWHIAGVIGFVVLFGIGHVNVINEEEYRVPRPLQRSVDRIVIALSVIAAIVFAAFSFFPQVYVTGVETNNQVAVVSEWVLLLLILYFNLMLTVRTVRLALYVHMSNVNHKREACKVCYELRA
jgi:hypothetical protein